MLYVRLIDAEDYSRTEERQVSTVQEAQAVGERAIIEEDYTRFYVIAQSVTERRETEKPLFNEIERTTNVY